MCQDILYCIVAHLTAPTCWRTGKNQILPHTTWCDSIVWYVDSLILYWHMLQCGRCSMALGNMSLQAPNAFPLYWNMLLYKFCNMLWDVVMWKTAEHVQESFVFCNKFNNMFLFLASFWWCRIVFENMLQYFCYLIHPTRCCNML